MVQELRTGLPGVVVRRRCRLQRRHTFDHTGGQEATAAKDYARARALYEQACAGGNATGCYNLGACSARAKADRRTRRVPARSTSRPAQEDDKGCYIVPILAMVYLLTPSGRCLARPLPDYTPVPRPSALD